jgi:hypothetical protein
VAIQEQPGLEVCDPVSDATSGLMAIRLNKQPSLEVVQSESTQPKSTAPELYIHSAANQPGLEELAVSPRRASWEEHPIETSDPGINHASLMLSNSAVELIGTTSGSTTKGQGTAIFNKHQEKLGQSKSTSLKGKIGRSKGFSGAFGSIKYSDDVLTAALEEAATLGSLPLVDFFVSQGSDVNSTSALAKDKYGTVIMDCDKPRNRALILAIEKNHVPIVNYLVTRCDQIQLSGGLLSAVDHSRTSIAKMLLAKGADVNHQDTSQSCKRYALGLTIQNEDSRESRIPNRCQNRKVSIPAILDVLESILTSLKLLRYTQGKYQESRSFPVLKALSHLNCLRFYLPPVPRYRTTSS